MHAQLEEGAASLRNVRDTESGDRVRRHPTDVLAIEGHRAAPLDHARDGSQRRGLSCAVCTEQRSGSGVLDIEIDAVKNLSDAVAGDEASD